MPGPLMELEAEHARVKAELALEQATVQELESCDQDELQEHNALVEEQA